MKTWRRKRAWARLAKHGADFILRRMKEPSVASQIFGSLPSPLKMAIDEQQEQLEVERILDREEDRCRTLKQ